MERPMHISARLMPVLGLYFTSAAPAPVLGQPALPEADPRVPVSDIVPQRLQAQSQVPSQPHSQPHSQALLAGHTDTIDQARSAEGTASDWIEASIPAAPAWQAETIFDVASRRRIEAEAQAHPLDVALDPDAGGAAPPSTAPSPSLPPASAILPERYLDLAQRLQEDRIRVWREQVKEMEDELSDLIVSTKRAFTWATQIDLARKMAAYRSEVVLHPEGTRLEELHRRMIERME
jgi:hypothetical protein